MYNIGKCVTTKKYLYEGRIIKRYHTIPENKEWQCNQDIKLTEEELSGNWYLIEVMCLCFRE